MPTVRVNPNRMELLKLRRRRQMAARGHKLLKDKLDELMKEFLARLQASHRLRREIERELIEVFGMFAMARAISGGPAFFTALASGHPADLLAVGERNVMSVRMPTLALAELPAVGGYSLVTTPIALDEALSRLSSLAPRLIELAEREKAIELLAAEIERTRRRVNALEHVLIPQLDAVVREIRMRLEEVERENLTRLMKVKEMIEAHQG